MDEPECLICGCGLRYLGRSKKMACSICHREYESDSVCVNGHYVCDGCHSGSAESAILHICCETDFDDPYSIAYAIMSDPSVHMHGPEHHMIVGCSLITAYRNAGGDINLRPALAEMIARGRTVPGGSCGNAGCCGAAVSAGMAFSIITGTAPLSTKTWGEANLLTSECLARIGSVGGPRCCKRDTALAIETAVGFIGDRLGVRMSLPKDIACGFSARNNWCLGSGCPYNR